MPALGKVGPLPGCLRGAFSSGRAGRLGRESGCGGGGGEKVLPQGLEGTRVSTAGAAPLRGGSTARAADEFSLLLAPTSYCGCLVARVAQAPSSWCRGHGLEVRARGEGARVPGAGRWLLAPPPEWLVRGSSRGAVSSSSLGVGWGPYDLRPLPARLPGAKARGFSATRCPGPILLKSLLPRKAGGGVGSRERSFSPPQRLPFRWRRLGLHGRREPPRPLLPVRTRAEERSARTQAPAAPRPGPRPGRRG